MQDYYCYNVLKRSLRQRGIEKGQGGCIKNQAMREPAGVDYMMLDSVGSLATIFHLWIVCSDLHKKEKLTV